MRAPTIDSLFRFENLVLNQRVGEKHREKMLILVKTISGIIEIVFNDINAFPSAPEPTFTQKRLMVLKSYQGQELSQKAQLEYLYAVAVFMTLDDILYEVTGRTEKLEKQGLI